VRSASNTESPYRNPRSKTLTLAASGGRLIYLVLLFFLDFLLSQPLIGMLSKFFEMKAGNYNTTLNASNGARPQANGTGFDPTTAPAQIPTRPLTRAEIERLYG
jgi:HAMP domain-containing protein